MFAIVAVSVVATTGFAQTVKPVARPPAPKPGAPPEGSAAPDGYAPIPEWLGQMRAPHPAKTAAYEVQTLFEGLQGAFSFALLPDGCVIVAECPGRLRVLDGNLKISPVEGLPADLFARGG